LKHSCFISPDFCSVHSMAHDRHILPSNYPSQQLFLALNMKPEPLLDTAGNAQYHTLGSSSIYHDHKELQPPIEHGPPKFSLPCLPSQDLHHRRASTRSRRAARAATRCRNPIAESAQYRAYRKRQPKDDKGDQKWPSDLEDAFLDGMQSL
jgi:hypothetical protein